MQKLEITDAQLEQMKKESAVLVKLIKIVGDLESPEARARVLRALDTLNEPDIASLE